MDVKLNNGSTGWIYWPEQCDYCKGYIFSDGKPCCKELTKEFFNKLRQIEHHSKGVYGSLSFKCDYFNLDDDKYNNSRYNECNCMASS